MRRVRISQFTLRRRSARRAGVLRPHLVLPVGAVESARLLDAAAASKDGQGAELTCPASVHAAVAPPKDVNIFIHTGCSLNIVFFP